MRERIASNVSNARDLLALSMTHRETAADLDEKASGVNANVFGHNSLIDIYISACLSDAKIYL